MSDVSPEPTPEATPAPVAVEPTGYHSYINSDGTFRENWADNAPDDIKPYVPTVARYPSLPEAFKGLHSLRQQLSKVDGMVRLPGEGASPEDVAEFRRKVGAPDSPEGYGLDKAPEGLTPEQWNSEFGSKVAAALHEHHASPELAKKLVAIQLEMAKADGAAWEAEQAKAQQAHAESLQQHPGAKAVLEAWGINPAIVPVEMHSKIASLAPLIKSDDGVRKALEIGELDMGGGNPKTRAIDIMTNPKNPLHDAYVGKLGANRQNEVRAQVHALINQAG